VRLPVPARVERLTLQAPAGRGRSTLMYRVEEVW
jgi:hypothetical protein